VVHVDGTTVCENFISALAAASYSSSSTRKMLALKHHKATCLGQFSPWYACVLSNVQQVDCCWQLAIPNSHTRPFQLL
jgi:hypothetical protein